MMFCATDPVNKDTSPLRVTGSGRRQSDGSLAPSAMPLRPVHTRRGLVATAALAALPWPAWASPAAPAAVLEAAGTGDFRNNLHVDFAVFVRAVREDWRLQPRAAVAGRVVDPGDFAGVSLRPTHEYTHPRTLTPLQGPARHPGALQSTG